MNFFSLAQTHWDRFLETTILHISEIHFVCLWNYFPIMYFERLIVMMTVSSAVLCLISSVICFNSWSESIFIGKTETLVECLWCDSLMRQDARLCRSTKFKKNGIISDRNKIVVSVYVDHGKTSCFFFSASQQVFEFNLLSLMTEAQKLFMHMVELVCDSENVIFRDSP